MNLPKIWTSGSYKKAHTLSGWCVSPLDRVETPAILPFSNSCLARSALRLKHCFIYISLASAARSRLRFSRTMLRCDIILYHISHTSYSRNCSIVAKGVKISTDQFPPPKKLAPKISSFSHAFPKN